MQGTVAWVEQRGDCPLLPGSQLLWLLHAAIVVKMPATVDGLATAVVATVAKADSMRWVGTGGCLPGMGSPVL